MNIRFYNAKILVPAENHKFQITEGELWVKGKEICYIGDGTTGVDAVCKNGEVLVWEREIDAKGNLLMPGFKDAHTHISYIYRAWNIGSILFSDINRQCSSEWIEENAHDFINR